MRSRRSGSIRQAGLPIATVLIAVSTAAYGQDVTATGDLSGAHECALMSEDFHPCTLATRPEGGYTISQPGSETFQGALTPQGAGFHLDGIYKAPSAPDWHLVGDVTLAGAMLKGRAKADNIPMAVVIRPAKAAKRAPKPTELSTTMARLVDKASVAEGTTLPLAIRVYDDPKRSFTVSAIDDANWEKIRGIFGMVPAANNIGIECKAAKLACTLTAQSSAHVVFYFAKTPHGLKLKRVDVPAEGD